jgi:hypothetical protein
VYKFDAEETGYNVYHAIQVIYTSLYIYNGYDIIFVYKHTHTHTHTHTYMYVFIIVTHR